MPSPSPSSEPSPLSSWNDSSQVFLSLFSLLEESLFSQEPLLSEDQLASLIFLLSEENCLIVLQLLSRLLDS